MERAVVMKIKMSRPYAAYKAGEVVSVTDDFAARLIAWGYAVVERQQSIDIEEAAIEPSGETADINSRRRKKQ
jgi:hypothetical protein